MSRAATAASVGSATAPTAAPTAAPAAAPAAAPTAAPTAAPAVSKRRDAVRGPSREESQSAVCGSGAGGGGDGSGGGATSSSGAAGAAASTAAAAAGVRKSADDADTIRTALAKNDIFAALAPAQLDRVVELVTKVDVPAGHRIITAGDTGESFYIVDGGAFAAHLPDALPGAAPAARYTAGDSFGELALLYNARRAATVACVKAGALWALSGAAFHEVMTASGQEALASRTRLLRDCEVFASLRSQQRYALAEAMEELLFFEGEKVARLGQPADALYFIKSGVVSCRKADGSEDVRLHSGELFGESCLRPGNKRLRHVVVVGGSAVVLRLSAKAFARHVGSLEQAVADNFKRRVLGGVEVDGQSLLPLLTLEEQGDLIRALSERQFKPGATVVEQGAEQHSLYLIRSGVARVVADGTRELALLGEGECFGERALLTGQKAAATVRAFREPLSCYVLGEADFAASCGQLKGLMERLRHRREAGEAGRAGSLGGEGGEGGPRWSDLEQRRIVGVGTLGRVRLVVHRPSGTCYALKAMRKAQVVGQALGKHVLAERRILSTMDHPFIVKLVATYQDVGELYMLLELGQGGELFSLLEREGKLREQPARFYVASACCCLAHIHAHEVVYRDLKPENLLLGKDGYLKLVDFGMAKALSDSEDARTWTVCGTPEYMAPEVVAHKGHSYPADWWTLGILGFECFCGVTPFAADDPMSVYRKVLRGQISWPSEIAAAGPHKAAHGLLEGLLEPRAAQRLGGQGGASPVEGTREVKAHGWFGGVDWRALEAKEVPPPFVPTLTADDDAGNFQEYAKDERLAQFPHAPKDVPRDAFAEWGGRWV